jgi:hypothetical protein
MAITRLSGGLTPADAADPRTFPSIWNATADFIEGGFLFAGTRYFFSDGTFAKADPFDDGNPSGLVVRALRVTVQAGGGGGRGADVTGAGEHSLGGGGGGGGFAQSVITDVGSLASTVSVSVGLGGTAGSGAGGAGAGGPSSFGALVAANGGISGAFNTINRAIVQPTAGGGSATAGEILINGGSSISGVIADIASGSGSSSRGGQGGSSLFGYSGGGGSNGSPAAGGGFGSGGSGAANAANRLSTEDGAPGRPGLVIVEVFV